MDVEIWIKVIAKQKLQCDLSYFHLNFKLLFFFVIQVVLTTRFRLFNL